MELEGQREHLTPNSSSEGSWLTRTSFEDLAVRMQELRYKEFSWLYGDLRAFGVCDLCIGRIVSHDNAPCVVGTQAIISRV